MIVVPLVNYFITLWLPVIAYTFLLFKVIQGHRLAHKWKALYDFPMVIYCDLSFLSLSVSELYRREVETLSYFTVKTA